MHKQPKEKRASYAAASMVIGDHSRLEMVHDHLTKKTAFALKEDGTTKIVHDYTTPAGEHLKPYSPDNNLLKHRVVLFPSAPDKYEDDATLLSRVQQYIHRYVDVSPTFERVAAYYVLFTWVYDRFNEVPYLRLRGDYGSGKTRFLQTVGSICYLPMFASGASTISPLFHMIDAFRGTLVIDEADFRLSDEKADIVKILNNGNVKGMPVLRTLVNSRNEYNPRAFTVFGPKIVASRGYYDDRALESRFITEEMGQRRLRKDIPLNLPPEQEEEAMQLRNQLLMYRLTSPTYPVGLLEPTDSAIEPRLNQVFSPLLHIIEDESCRQDLRRLARTYHNEILADRGMTLEAQVLQVIRHLTALAKGPNIPLRDIADTFARYFGRDFEQQITNKWIGSILRARLHLKTHKSEGIYVLPLSERPVLDLLFDRYGITEDDICDEKASDEFTLIFEPDEEQGH